MNTAPEPIPQSWKRHRHLAGLPWLVAQRGEVTPEELDEMLREWREAKPEESKAELEESKTETKDADGDDILHFCLLRAVHTRQFHLVPVFLDHGAGPNLILWDLLEASASLFFANRWAKTRAQELVRELLERGADPNASSVLYPKKHALGFAVARNNVELVQMLLDHGADLNHPTIEHELGRTDPKIMRLLLERGASAKVNEHFGNQRETALHRAAALHRPESVALLLEHGADPNCVNANGDTPLHLVSNVPAAKMLLDAGASVEAVNQLGETVLHAQMGHHNTTSEDANTEVVELLLESGVSVNALNKNGVPALDYAARCRDSWDETTGLVPLLLKHGADPNAGNCNALHHTAKDKDDFEALCALLCRGASTSTVMRGSERKSIKILPLDCACEAGNLDAIYEITMAMVGEGNLLSLLSSPL